MSDTCVTRSRAEAVVTPCTGAGGHCPGHGSVRLAGRAPPDREWMLRDEVDAVCAALVGVDYLDNRRATVTRGQDGAIWLAVLQGWETHRATGGRFPSWFFPVSTSWRSAQTTPTWGAHGKGTSRTASVPAGRLRGLCRAHGVTAHSAVVVQARQGNWAEKRRAYRDRASSKYIEQRADRAALREAEVRDHAIASGRTFGRPRRSSSTGSGSSADPAAEAPRPLLIDRIQVLFGRPAIISEGRGFAATFTSEALPVEVLRGIVEATRGLAGAPAAESSPLPRAGGQ